MALAAASGAPALAQQSPAIPLAEMLLPPTVSRMEELGRFAAGEPWSSVVLALRFAARRAYSQAKLPAAGAWINTMRWAAIFAQTDREFITGWIAAVGKNGVNHPNMPQRFRAGDERLGRWVSPELQNWLMGNAGFSEEFFATISQVDYLPEVLKTLDTLHRRDPARFARYASLALAIAVVYDVPPPPAWPHGQVSREALRSGLPSPEEAFDWWTQQDSAGRTYQRLDKLEAAELKFVVDVNAPFEELTWSQKNVICPLTQFGQAYAMIRYRPDRVAADRMSWPGRSYTLPAILTDGGICVVARSITVEPCEYPPSTIFVFGQLPTMP